MKTKILLLLLVNFSTAMFAQSTVNVVGGAPVNGVGSDVVGAVIAGGGASDFEGSSQPNRIDSNFSTISGGLNHSIQSGSIFSTISGGRDNLIEANSYYSAIGGGLSNTVSTYSSVISGGRGNEIRVKANDGTISGGVFNVIQNDAPYSTIGGGWDNTIQPNSSECSIGGGRDNAVGNSSQKSTIAGGSSNGIEANSPYASIGGGVNNTVRSGGTGAAIGGGSANRAAGQYGTVPGGINNFAGGNCSFAAGRRAKAAHRGAFVWGDSTDADVSSTAINQFVVRASGGVRLLSNAAGTVGVRLAANGTSWATLSDRNAKKNFQSVNCQKVLETLATIPVQKWNYKWESDSDVPHIGPVAQDFKGAFYPGRDDQTITTLEFDGVELAAIQGLNQKLEQKDKEIKELKRDLVAVRAIVEELKQRFDHVQQGRQVRKDSVLDEARAW